MASKVFISWSGELSKKLAEEVRIWLPGVLQFVKPYFTPNDIEKGTRWSTDIASELESSSVGIICLTKDNLNKPWILFEAGALSKNFGKSNVCTILFNFDSTDFSGPLTSFQATKFDKADFKKLLVTVNNTGGESKLDSTVLNDVFEMWWPRLETKINEILKSHVESSPHVLRSEREILEEVLELTRINTKRFPRRSDISRGVLQRLVDMLIEMQYRLMKYGGKDSMMLYDEMRMNIKHLSIEIDEPELYERFIMNTEKGII
ncbi:MAG: toll/interleukin-1 receptor domain-containing protein, partial [Bacteroidia bacterium]|nr:toll/interleukin-1 receptor domain-containing protein [Bacteroidia bacterium]